MFRLGSNTSKKPRPLKVFLFENMFSSYFSALRNGLQTPTNFRISRDRTSLEREVLHAAYAELEHRRLEDKQMRWILRFCTSTMSFQWLNQFQKIEAMKALLTNSQRQNES